ncbi:flagellar assembly peptidoglycan hydrolase FlgJ [Aurantivibrio infirmus]
MNMDTTASLALENSSYTDLNGLNRINQLGKKDQDLALKELAKQFESIFLNLMLKTMRDSNAVFEEGGLFQSNEMKFHRDMFDNQLALTMSEGQGIGLADAFYNQMIQQYPQGPVSTTNIPNMEMPLPTRRIPISPSNSTANNVSSQGLTDIRFNESNSPNSNQKQLDVEIPIDTQPASANQHANEKIQIEFDGDPTNFVQKIYPYAQNAAEKLAVDPETLIAQAALETGWGKHVIYGSDGESSNNIFNMKANKNWQGDSVAVSALEYKDGIAVQENSTFKKYDSIQDSFNDYAKLISQHPRYQRASSKVETEEYLNEIHSAGYATDPNYVEKIMTLYNGDVIQSARNLADPIKSISPTVSFPQG